MRILISGDRHYERVEPIVTAITGLMEFDGALTVIHGDAPGADTIAGMAAQAIGATEEPYPAKWDEYGRAAGPIRNKQMLDEGQPDVVLCFHDDLENSRGTGNMAKQAKKAGVPVYNIRRL